MDKLFRDTNGQVDFTKIFMALATSVVLVLQQWQTYRISELKTMGEIKQQQFYSKQEVTDKLDSLKLDKTELLFIKKRLDRIEAKIEEISHKLH